MWWTVRAPGSELPSLCCEITVQRSMKHLVFGASDQHRLLAGQERGQIIPLADANVHRNDTAL